ncbi:unnamed protein product [Urochloa humidicola]
MWMLSSCTLLSLAPPAVPAPGKFPPAVLQLRRTKQPTASPSAMALPKPAPRYKVSRAPRLVCHAHTYDIQPSVLLHPSVGEYDNWRINENKDHIVLGFNVGKDTKEDKLEVRTTKDHEELWLVIKYKQGDGSDNDNSPASSLNARLQMPRGYVEDNVMQAEILRDGWLQIIIEKPKPTISPENKLNEPKKKVPVKKDEEPKKKVPAKKDEETPSPGQPPQEP